MSKGAVLVTGANGYIGQHVVDKLLQRGYPTIGTVRSLESSNKTFNNFKEKYPDSEFVFECVPDVAIDGAFDELLKKHTEIKYVIHMASPVTLGTGKSYDEEFLEPAVNGTLNILKGIKALAPQVTNVVITSSFVAIMQTGDDYINVVHTNKLWAPLKWEDVSNPMDAYIGSKKYAEMAAHKFYAEEKPNFKLAVVTPPVVLGPQVFDNTFTTFNLSNGFIGAALQVDPKSTEPQTGTVTSSIDVRDMAEFHILPLEVEALAEERILVVSDNMTIQKVLNILNKHFPELDGKIAKGDPESVERLDKELGPKVDISDTINKLPNGYNFIPFEETVIQTFKQYFAKNPLV